MLTCSLWNKVHIAGIYLGRQNLIFLSQIRLASAAWKGGWHAVLEFWDKSGLTPFSYNTFGLKQSCNIGIYPKRTTLCICHALRMQQLLETALKSQHPSYKMGIKIYGYWSFLQKEVISGLHCQSAFERPQHCPLCAHWETQRFPLFWLMKVSLFFLVLPKHKTNQSRNCCFI